MDWARALSPHYDLSDPGPYPFAPDSRDPFDAIIPPLPNIGTQPAQGAYVWVLNYAGAKLPVRDTVDTRVVATVVSGVATNGPRTNGIINLPSDVGGYPVIASVVRSPDWDTDGDGMPDDWELTHGLDPKNGSDRNEDFNTDGYTNLEEYLNELGAFPAVQEIVWDGQADNRYARIENWDLAFQPSHFDVAVISNATVVVDAVGQSARVLRLVDHAALEITNGWLNIAERLIISTNSTIAVRLSGTLNIASNLVNEGLLRMTEMATLSVGGSMTNYGTLDIMTWGGVLPTAFVNHGTVLDREDIHLDSISTGGDGVQLKIHGYVGHAYQLQTRENL